MRFEESVTYGLGYKLHVCMATTGFDTILPQAVGAIESYIYGLSQHLSKNNLVDVFGRGEGSYEKQRLRIHTFSYDVAGISRYPRIRELTYGFLFDKYLILKVKELHKKCPVDIFHINTLYATVAGGFLKTFLHIPTVCSVHNTFQASFLIRFCDKILANSEYMKRFLIKERHIEKERVDVLPIAVDIEGFSARAANDRAEKELELQDRDVILFVGRKVPYKGPQVLIDALPEISKENPKSLALFVGPDYFFGSNSRSYSAFLEERARRIGVIGNVAFRGYVSDQALRDYYKAADILVCPSIWQEPFGKVVIEAYACQKPVVATKVGALPEIVQDGASGILIPPNNPKALANAVCSLLNDRKRAKRMGKKGREIVEHRFSFQVVSERCQTIYEGVAR
jgi:glycosyltransferase involved in cell wall biosynthesis